MIESLDELKAIRDGAPKVTTIVDIDDDGDVSYMYHSDDHPVGQRILDALNGEDAAIEYSDGNIRSLSDINRIIDLTEALLLISDLSLVTGDEGIQKHLDSLLTERNE